MTEDRMEDRVTITEMKMARLHGSDDLLLRFIYKAPAGTGDHAVLATPSLQLTREQARHLLLLLGKGLGFPNSDIPDVSKGPRH